MNTICAICSVLTRLAVDDKSAAQIRECNGVYTLGQLLLESARTPRDLRPSGGDTSRPAASSAAEAQQLPAGTTERPSDLSMYVFRTMRFVFSMERNRKIFKRLFPPALFAAFIDVGHYTQNLAAYGEPYGGPRGPARFFFFFAAWDLWEHGAGRTLV